MQVAEAERVDLLVDLARERALAQALVEAQGRALADVQVESSVAAVQKVLATRVLRSRQHRGRVALWTAAARSATVGPQARVE